MSEATARPRRPDRQRPAGRYGPPPSRRRRWAGYIVGGIAAGVALAALLTLAVHRSAPAVAAQVTGYDVLSDTTVRIRFEVRKAPLVEAVCVVRARNRSGMEAGRAEVTVGARPDAGRTTEVRYDLPTRSRAVTGELAGCRVSRAH